MDLFEYIRNLIEEKGSVVVSIDGMSGAGKTIFAKKLSALGESRIIYMSDFALPPELRTEQRYRRLGGNIHHERFKSEVVEHIRDDLSYGVLTVDDNEIRETKTLKKAPLTIVVGTYAMHPEFGEYYDLSFYLGVDPKEQIKRLAKRDLGKLKEYKERWLPMENAYLEKNKIKDKADVLLG